MMISKEIKEILLKTFDFLRPICRNSIFCELSELKGMKKGLCNPFSYQLSNMCNDLDARPSNSNAERAQNLENLFTFTLYIQNT